MKCKFFVGQTVICIDAYDTDANGKQELVEGRAYTITRLEPIDDSMTPHRNHYSGAPSIGVHILGVMREGEMPFDYRRFRKPIDGELKDEAWIKKKTPKDELV